MPAMASRRYARTSFAGASPADARGERAEPDQNLEIQNVDEDRQIDVMATQIELAEHEQKHGAPARRCDPAGDSGEQRASASTSSPPCQVGSRRDATRTDPRRSAGDQSADEKRPRRRQSARQARTTANVRGRRAMASSRPSVPTTAFRQLRKPSRLRSMRRRNSSMMRRYRSSPR